ncbi:MAG: reductive dehalogenase [Anaerolineae bacterium]
MLEGKAPKEQLGPYPLQRLRRVEEPTSYVGPNVQRVSEREAGFIRAAWGDYGPRLKAEVDRFVQKEPVAAALSQITGDLASLELCEVYPDVAPLPRDRALLSRHIKALGYFLRSDCVGVCKLPQYAVYSSDRKERPIELNHEYAVVFLIDQGWRTFNGAVGSDWISAAQSFKSYSTSGFIATIVANYIRRLGYEAEPHFSGHYKVLIPPLVLLAGLGEMSRFGGTVLNPFLGPRFKASAVTTNLPLKPDKLIDFGLQDYCKVCKKCARECPSQSISYSDEMIIYNDYATYEWDVEGCTRMRVGNPAGASCGRCIKVCPWNKPYQGIHKVVEWSLERSSLARRFSVWMDDLLGYGKQNLEDKWWYDLEEIEGTFMVPEKVGATVHDSPLTE